METESISCKEPVKFINVAVTFARCTQYGNGATKGAYLSVFLELTNGLKKTSQ